MSNDTVEPKTKNLREVEDVIARAIKKVGAKRENDICRYIPMTSGGYMHHFTLKKMKTKQPSELGAMIEKFIINADRPGMVAPKQRAARGSRKRRDHITFTRNQLERMLAIARLAGDKEMVGVLSPKRSLATCKRELIASIRHNKVELELWNAYVESINVQQAIQNSELFTNLTK
jgi:hypothetical protein